MARARATAAETRGDQAIGQRDFFQHVALVPGCDGGKQNGAHAGGNDVWQSCDALRHRIGADEMCRQDCYRDQLIGILQEGVEKINAVEADAVAEQFADMPAG